jgi:hypothetical protein
VNKEKVKRVHNVPKTANGTVPLNKNKEMLTDRNSGYFVKVIAKKKENKISASRSGVTFANISKEN